MSFLSSSINLLYSCSAFLTCCFNLSINSKSDSSWFMISLFFVTNIDDNTVTIKVEDGRSVDIKYFKVDLHKIKFEDYSKELGNHYSVVNSFIPLKPCNAMTIHKSQGMTLCEAILNCDGIFSPSMFYTALSRIQDPNNMKVINFSEKYVKCNKSAIEYETEGKYISYFEQMLIDNDDTKLNVMKVKSPDNILDDNTIIYDFECATCGKSGHKPYFNHLIKLYKGSIDQEQTFCHYTNSNDANKDTFEYIMKIVTYQCDMYLKGKEKGNKALVKEFRNHYICVVLIVLIMICISS